MFKQEPDFSLRGKRLFEISEVKLTRVDCSLHADNEDLSIRWALMSEGTLSHIVFNEI